MRKDTRPGSTALTSWTGIATRLKLIVPLHMPCDASSSPLSGEDLYGTRMGLRVFMSGNPFQARFKDLKELVRRRGFHAPWAEDCNLLSTGFFVDQVLEFFLVLVLEFLWLKTDSQLIDQIASDLQLFF